MDEPDRFPGYSLLMASDVAERDGLGLELYDHDRTLLAEVFRDDSSGLVTFRLIDTDQLPLDVLLWFLGRARTRLLD